MKKVALVIDNSGSLTKQEIEKIKITKIVPISFIVNGEEYYEDKNMSYEEFYQFLSDKNTNVSTCQPSIELVKEEWREILKEYNELVYIILSSGLSESCNTAINASHDPEFEGKVFVPNNQRVAFLNKIQMFQARAMIDAGKSGKEIKDYLEQTKSDTGVYIAVDTLKYLKKGGRVTPAAAAIGTLLNIKPILQIHGGKLDAYAKVMSMKQAKAKMIAATKREIEERFPEEAKQGKVYIGMAHSNPNLEAQEIKDFEAEVRAAFPDYPFFTHDPLPLFIVCHTGPNAMAVGYCVDKLDVIKDMLK
ncbi:MAG: DegV family protein [Clostridia bacterium]|nr:DegV family protein [Clostridia bacterium]